MSGSSEKQPPRNPLLGAAVLKALLSRDSADGSGMALELYKGVLRDLHLTEAEVDTYLAGHAAEVEDALRRRGQKK